MKRLFFVLALSLSSLALGEPLQGKLGSPGLRRSVQLVYVEKVDGKFSPPAKPVEMNQKNNTFSPALVPLVVGTKVTFKSEDAELHNVFAREGLKVLFNQGQPAKAVFQKEFTQPGPVHLTCNIHREMSAWVIVLQNPYWATPDKSTGAFVIDGLPPGTYALRLWGEKLDEELAAKKFPFTIGPTQAPVQIAER